MLKVGDRLYCWNNNVNDWFSVDCTIGRFYVITSIFDNPKSIVIMNNNVNDWFSCDKFAKPRWYYGDYFYTEVEVRRCKLIRLNNVDTL